MRPRSYLPQLSGTEEETRIGYARYAEDRLVDLRPFDHPELEQLNELIHDHCEPLILDAPTSIFFRENGSKTYVDTGGVELATPEVNNPADQAVYIKANAMLLEKALADFLKLKSRRHGEDVTAVFQRRTIDSRGNTWACHDNYSVDSSVGYKRMVSDQLQPISRLWLGFITSRNFITGAMRVGPDKVEFSQKLSQPHKFNEYSYDNSILRVDVNDGQRLELRCNDINLQDWATVCRIGGGAMFLAATMTPIIANKLLNSMHYAMPWPRNDAWNDIPLNQNLELTLSRQLKQNIAVQRFTFQTILNDYEAATGQPMPRIYLEIGKTILDYCDEVEAIANGYGDIYQLADRVDWATKLYTIRRDIRRNPKRRLNDARSIYLDLLYDQIKITATPKGKLSTSHGYGHKAANKTSFYSNRPHLLERAMRFPPAKSRGAARLAYARRYGNKLVDCDWSSIQLQDGSNIRTINLSPDLADT